MHARLLPACYAAFRPCSLTARPGLASLGTESFPAGAGAARWGGQVPVGRPSGRNHCFAGRAGIAGKLENGSPIFFPALPAISSVASNFRRCRQFPALPAFSSIARPCHVGRVSKPVLPSSCQRVANYCHRMPDIAGRRHAMPYGAGAGIRCHMTQVAAVTGSIDERRGFQPHAQ